MTVTQTAAAQSEWRFQRSASGEARTVVFERSRIGHVQDGSRNKVVRDAVLGHIKVLRKLGQTRVNTREIAESLNLSRALVEQAVMQLEGKGVKIAK